MSFFLTTISHPFCDTVTSSPRDRILCIKSSFTARAICCVVFSHGENNVNITDNAKKTLNSFLKSFLLKIYLSFDIPTPLFYLFFRLNIVSTPAIINANTPAMNVLICEIPVDGNLPLILSVFPSLLISLTFEFSSLRVVFDFGTNVPISKI